MLTIINQCLVAYTGVDNSTYGFRTEHRYNSSRTCTIQSSYVQKQLQHIKKYGCTKLNELLVDQKVAPEVGKNTYST